MRTKAEHAAYMRRWNALNRERVNAQRRARWHTTKYGITDEERLELFESSDGLCALCYEEPATVIDHDHETGKVRGALCARCNKGLGFFESMSGIEEYLSAA